MAKVLIYKVTPAPERDPEAAKANAAAQPEVLENPEGVTGTITVTPKLAKWREVPVNDEHLSQLDTVGGIVGVENNGDHAIIRVLEEPIHDREVAQLRLRQIFGAEPDYQGFEG